MPVSFSHLTNTNQRARRTNWSREALGPQRVNRAAGTQNRRVIHRRFPPKDQPPLSIPPPPGNGGRDSHQRRIFVRTGHLINTTPSSPIETQLKDANILLELNPVVINGQQTHKRRASQTEYELVRANFFPPLAEGRILFQTREGINVMNVDEAIPKDLMNLPTRPMLGSITGFTYVSRMMSTIVSAFSGVGEKFARFFYNDSYGVAEQRSYAGDGHVSNKRAKTSPPPFDEMRWITYRDPEFRNLQSDSEQFSVVFENVRETGNIFCSEASTDAIQRLNRKLEPLTSSLVDDSTELHAVRYGEWPDLAIAWLRGLRRISAFLGVMYHIHNITELPSKHNNRVPHAFKHGLGPVFEANMKFTKRILANPRFKRVFAEVCAFWGLAYDGVPVSRVLEQVILDISAMENDLPPPSFIVSPTYRLRLQAKFPPPAWATDDVYLSYNPLQEGEIPGMFPEKLVQSSRRDLLQDRYLSGDAGDDQDPRWTTIERRAEDQLRDIAATRAHSTTSPHIYANPRAGRGMWMEDRTRDRRNDYISRRTRSGRVSRAGMGKSESIRAKFGAQLLTQQRVSQSTQSNPNRHVAVYNGFKTRSPLDHRTTIDLRSILRKRAPRYSDQTVSPRLRRTRHQKSVRFADGILSPQTRSRSGFNIPRVDPTYTPSSLELQLSSQSSAQDSLEPTPEPQAEMEPRLRIADYENDMRHYEELQDTMFTKNEFPKYYRRYEPMPPAEQLTEEEIEKRIRDLLLLPSPEGLRQSDDSKIAIKLRKQKEAAKAAEAKRKAEEKAKEEARERARRELEERLAKSGGLRLPNQEFIGPLSLDWTHRAQNTLRAGATTNLATTGEGVDLRRHDFAKVVPETEWLNDEIVNGSLNWLDRAINSAAGIKNVKSQTRKCLALSSFFWKRLKDQGVTGTIRTLSRNGVKKDNLLDVETILLPVCENLHWTLVVIRPTKRTVAHMDSLNPRGNAANTSLALAWMKEVLQEKFIDSEWKIVRHEAPRQTNGWDCGVHTITNAMCVSLGLSPIDCYSAADMPLQRLRIACILLNGGFTGDFDLQVY